MNKPEENKVGTSGEEGGEEGQGEGKGEKEGDGKSYGEGTQKLAETFLLEKFSIISKILQQNIEYPYIAQRMGWEGRVIVSFILTKEGKIEDIKIEKSSGYEILDKNTVATLKRCAKYFPIPPVNVKIKVPVVYQLR